MLLLAPGGVRSSIAHWQRAAWDPIRELAPYFRVIALDQRNAGRSRAPVRGSDGWHVYTADHLALLEHLAIERVHLLGGCIGASFALSLLQVAPERVAAAVLQQPIGQTEGNRALFHGAFDDWAHELSARQPDTSPADFGAFREHLFGGDFVFSVSRDAVRAMRAPLLVLLGNDAHHPSETSREIVALAQNAQLVERWKEPDVVRTTVSRVLAFLQTNTPL